MKIPQSTFNKTRRGMSIPGMTYNRWLEVDLVGTNFLSNLRTHEISSDWSYWYYVQNKNKYDTPHDKHQGMVGYPMIPQAHNWPKISVRFEPGALKNSWSGGLPMQKVPCTESGTRLFTCHGSPSNPITFGNLVFVPIHPLAAHSRPHSSDHIINVCLYPQTPCFTENPRTSRFTALSLNWYRMKRVLPYSLCSRLLVLSIVFHISTRWVSWT